MRKRIGGFKAAELEKGSRTDGGATIDGESRIDGGAELTGENRIGRGEWK